MEYEQLPNFSHGGHLGYQQYYLTLDRNAPLAASHSSRPDFRSYPVGGLRKGLPGRDEEPSEATQPARRRIAVACARCRKRKIRCSGDPGNGLGCQSCKAAGADINMCQFHRVGSQDIPAAMSQLANLPNPNPNLGNGNAMMPIYNARSPVYSRSYSPSQLPQINTKAIMPQSWAVPCPDDTSPVGLYGLEQQACMPTQNDLSNMYGTGYRWPESDKAVQNSRSSYLDHDSSPSNGLPYISTSNTRSVGNSEQHSPLNMSSLQSTLPLSILPDRPHARQLRTLEGMRPPRQLPVLPQPTPSQTPRNPIDQQREKIFQKWQLSFKAGIAKPTSQLADLPLDIQTTVATKPPTTSDLTAPTATSSGLTDSGLNGGLGSATDDSNLDYIPVTSPSTEENTPASSAAQINFNTSTLFDPMAIPTTPAPTATYSNFRDYHLPTCSSPTSTGLLARQSSQYNLYNFSTDSAAKHGSFGGSEEGTLVSGQRYAPLGQPQTHHAVSTGNLRRKSFDARNIPTHRASMSNINSSL